MLRRIYHRLQIEGHARIESLLVIGRDPGAADLMRVETKGRYARGNLVGGMREGAIAQSVGVAIQGKVYRMKGATICIDAVIAIDRCETDVTAQLP